MIRLYNGKLLSLCDGFEISDWEVWVEESMILYVGPAIGAHPPFEREIDLRGNLLMPGFKNAHAHSAMTFLRSYADDLPLQSWLFDKVFPLEAKLTPDDIYALTKLAILEYVRGGVTSAFDMYYKREAFAQAAIDCGYRMVLCGALAAGDDWTVGEMDTVKFNNLHPLISYIPGIHAEYTANLDLLMFMKMLLDEYKMPFFTHNSETKREVDECIARYGKSPVAWFEELGTLDSPTAAAHCVAVSDEDIAILKRHGVNVIHNPTSNLKLGSGFAPVRKLMDAGINLALGTDGAASNNNLDMFEEMHLADIMPCGYRHDPTEVSSAEVLDMATVNGARLQGRSDTGVLAVGKKADIIALDLDKPHLYPNFDTPALLTCAAHSSDVVLTMVDGKILYENGEYKTLDREKVFYEARAAVKRLYA